MFLIESICFDSTIIISVEGLCPSCAGQIHFFEYMTVIVKSSPGHSSILFEEYNSGHVLKAHVNYKVWLKSRHCHLWPHLVVD